MKKKSKKKRTIILLIIVAVLLFTLTFSIYSETIPVKVKYEKNVDGNEINFYIGASKVTFPIEKEVINKTS